MAQTVPCFKSLILCLFNFQACTVRCTWLRVAVSGAAVVGRAASVLFPAGWQIWSLSLSALMAAPNGGIRRLFPAQHDCLPGCCPANSCDPNSWRCRWSVSVTTWAN